MLYESWKYTAFSAFIRVYFVFVSQEAEGKEVSI